jgi:hypothetical protein
MPTDYREGSPYADYLRAGMKEFRRARAEHYASALSNERSPSN